MVMIRIHWCSGASLRGLDSNHSIITAGVQKLVISLTLYVLNLSGTRFVWSYHRWGVGCAHHWPWKSNCIPVHICEQPCLQSCEPCIFLQPSEGCKVSREEISFIFAGQQYFLRSRGCYCTRIYCICTIKIHWTSAPAKMFKALMSMNVDTLWWIGHRGLSSMFMYN